MAEQLSDEQLMARYVNGHESAFSELYRRYNRQVYGFISTRTNASNAEELFQQVFLKLHRSRDRYDSNYPFVTWLFAICRNTLKDYYRAVSRRPETLTDQAEDIQSPTEAGRSELSDELEAAIGSLPERQREIVRLRFSEGLEFEDIAKRQNTTQENVRKIISRSIQVLKKAMGRE